MFFLENYIADFQKLYPNNNNEETFTKIIIPWIMDIDNIFDIFNGHRNLPNMRIKYNEILKTVEYKMYLF
jgi:hypothetical protein